MARRRRIGTVGFDQKIILDVGLAAIAVRVLPTIASNFIAIDPTLYTVVGAGGGYLAGTFFKNKTLANASIALGLVEFVMPMVTNLVGGGYGPDVISAPIFGAPKVKGYPKMMPPKVEAMGDYITLNDYTDYPSNRMDVTQYRENY